MVGCFGFGVCCDVIVGVSAFSVYVLLRFVLVGLFVLGLGCGCWDWFVCVVGLLIAGFVCWLL